MKISKWEEDSARAEVIFNPKERKMLKQDFHDINIGTELPDYIIIRSCTKSSNPSDNNDFKKVCQHKNLKFGSNSAMAECPDCHNMIRYNEVGKPIPKS